MFEPGEQKFICEYCGSDFAEGVVRQKEEERLRAEADAAANATRAGEEFCNQMDEYACPNCGAEVIADENTVATFCVYCHSPVIHRGKLSGQLRPTKIVPFQFSREQAEEIFLKFAHKYKFVPRGFFAKGQIEKMQAIYYPFWITDADARANFTGKATRTRAFSTGGTKYIETSYFRVERAGDVHFEDITTAAISDADKQMLEGILPFPSAALEDFSMPYLSGVLTKKRDLDRAQLQQEVNAKMDIYARDILRGTVTDFRTVQVEAANANAYRENWEYALMPLYVMVYRGKKRNYTYAMNGYTGKVYGELPVSRGKLWALFGAVAAAVTTVATLIGGFLL